jgi:hypothetical protein
MTSCPSQSTQLAEFHNVILTTLLIQFLVSSNSPFPPPSLGYKFSGGFYAQKY